MHATFKPKIERENLQDLDLERIVNLNAFYKTWDVNIWTGFVWLRLEFNGLAVVITVINITFSTND